MTKIKKSLIYNVVMILYFGITLCLWIFANIGIALIVSAVGTLLHYFTLQHLYRKIAQKELEEQDANHMELTYFWTIDLSPALFPLLFIKLSPMNTNEPGGKLSLAIGLLCELFFIGHLLYHAMTKIVFDNGQITLYVAGRKKVTGHVNEINPERTRASRLKPGNRTYSPPQILFGTIEGKRYVVFSEFMSDSEKLVAYLYRRKLFDDLL